ncbi:MAG TPA: FAD-binding oxidoreductase, partial [Thermomicrobiales bacterium]|nr:FAD-binding oxidoreductase [Thermomicrobiales bacterium]
GGGISGTSATYELAKRGAHVTLVEREQLHAMASGWTLAGVRQSGRLAPELPIAQAAIRRWEHLAEELGADLEYRQAGNLRLALNEDEVPIIRRVVEDGVAAGIPMEYIDAAHVRELAPIVTDQVVGASFCPTDGHANNHLAVTAYADAATRLGATIRTGTEVTGLIVNGDRVSGVHTTAGDLHADIVIVAAGVYTPRLLAPLGLQLPLQVVLCPIFTTEPTDPVLAPVLGVADATFAGRQEASGRLRLIGVDRSFPWTEDQHTPGNTMPTTSSTEHMIRNAIRVLPAVADLRVDRIWGGLIDRTPDVLPVIERSPAYEGLVIAAGFSGHGFGIGPATGEILADLATTGASRFDLSAFTLDRFRTGVAQAKLEMHG